MVSSCGPLGRGLTSAGQGACTAQERLLSRRVPTGKPPLVPVTAAWPWVFLTGLPGSCSGGGRESPSWSWGHPVLMGWTGLSLGPWSGADRPSRDPLGNQATPLGRPSSTNSSGAMISDPQQAERATELAIMPSLSREGVGFEKGPQLIAFGPPANAAGCLRQGAPTDSRSGPAWSGSPARLGSRVESCVSSPKSRWVHMIDFPVLCDSSPGLGACRQAALSLSDVRASEWGWASSP